jgi:uncharacterized membrane-anchored protein YitT (DUF2179 family)
MYHRNVIITSYASRNCKSDEILFFIVFSIFFSAFHSKHVMINIVMITTEENQKSKENNKNKISISKIV